MRIPHEPVTMHAHILYSSLTTIPPDFITYLSNHLSPPSPAVGLRTKPGQRRMQFSVKLLVKLRGSQSLALGCHFQQPLGSSNSRCRRGSLPLAVVAFLSIKISVQRWRWRRDQQRRPWQQRRERQQKQQPHLHFPVSSPASSIC